MPFMAWNRQGPVIFLSSDKRRAFDCFRLNALDFLLSTDPYHVFLTSANKALQRLSLQTPEAQPTHIYIKSEYRIIRIDFDSIDYIESCDDYVKFHCNNRDKPILSLCSLKKLEAVLPASDFIRVHRSYIVRKQSIKVIENRSIVFNKTRIPVSKASLKVLQEAIHICQWIGNKKSVPIFTNRNTTSSIILKHPRSLTLDDFFLSSALDKYLLLYFFY